MGWRKDLEEALKERNWLVKKECDDQILASTEVSFGEVLFTINFPQYALDGKLLSIHYDAKYYDKMADIPKSMLFGSLRYNANKSVGSWVIRKDPKSEKYIYSFWARCFLNEDGSIDKTYLRHMMTSVNSAYFDFHEEFSIVETVGCR